MIYFIQAGENGNIKIGKTVDVLKRLKQLQTGNSSELILLATYEGNHEEEQRLHNRFKEYKIRGEWYERVPEIVNFISKFKPNHYRNHYYWYHKLTDYLIKQKISKNLYWLNINIFVEITASLSFVPEFMKQAEERWNWRLKTTLNYNLNDLILHLRKQFNIGMNWDNYISYWCIELVIKDLKKFNHFKDNYEYISNVWVLNNMSICKN